MVKTKIIATLGPATDRDAVLRKMFLNGLDTVRLNFSHGKINEHLQRIRQIRTLNRKMRRSIKIMQDLEGFRIRIGKLSEPINLVKHHVFWLTQKDVAGDENEVSFDYEGSLKPIKNGMHIFIDDGRIVLQVLKTEKHRLNVRVLAAHPLREHKGINIPDAELDFGNITEKDKHDIGFAIEHRLDYVALSFVRHAGDVLAFKKILNAKHAACQIISKIENREALHHIDEILEVSDGIMVARGDMGICVPIYKVPVIQKELVKRARLAGKPVIVATQMLESMTDSLIPTRAEASDVANAVLDGATHVMLSAETAVGHYPAETVGMMNRIIQNTEAYEGKLQNLLEG